MPQSWLLAYDGFHPEEEGLRESLCTLGNGYIATRGAGPEAEAGDVHYPGTYLAGGYNRLKTDIAGRVVENEDLVNLPNWLSFTFRIDGDTWFHLGAVEILSYRQELNLKQGVLTRTIHFRDKQGRRTKVSSRRFVHMKERHLCGLETSLTAENWSGNLEVLSGLDGRVVNAGVARYRQLSSKHLEWIKAASFDGDSLLLQVRTNQSHLEISQAARLRVLAGGKTLNVERHTVEEPGFIAQKLSVELAPGQAVTFEKIVSIFTSKDRATSESGLEAHDVIQRSRGFDQLLQGHVLAWKHLWHRCSIEVDDGERTALVLRLHIFHLLQTVSFHAIDLDVGVPARGWHGEAYRGHVFWDELFIFPFLNLRIPELTRSLLLYRYRRLGEARAAAKAAGFRGAMFPWQSGSNGREESQRVHLNPRSGRWVPDNTYLQRHVNAAIAYNIWQYYQVTNDLEFMYFFGAEMILEIARFWASVTVYNPEVDRYEIHNVMGPDEYHDAYPDAREPGLRNNAYTNIMAVWVLCRALDVLETLPEERREELRTMLALEREEIELWEEISRKMRLVFFHDGVLSQFEGYENLEELDWDAYRAKYGAVQRLDRLLEAEGDSPNRYKVSKQADVLMLFYLFSAEELGELFERLRYPFPYETIPKNVNYYLERTTHGSSLSGVVNSWVLARSDRPRSWRLFTQALEGDIKDSQHGTTAEGIHLGAMSGTVDLIQRGYTGIEARGDVLRFNPSLPAQLKRLRMSLRYRQQWLEVEVTQERLKVSNFTHGGNPVRIGFREDVLELQSGGSREFRL